MGNIMVGFFSVSLEEQPNGGSPPKNNTRSQVLSVGVTVYQRELLPHLAFFGPVRIRAGHVQCTATS